VSKPDQAPRFAIEGSGHPGPDRAGRMGSQGSDGRRETTARSPLRRRMRVGEGRTRKGEAWTDTRWPQGCRASDAGTLKRINPRFGTARDTGSRAPTSGGNRRHGTRKGAARQRKYPERVLVTAEAHSGFSAS